MNAPNPREMANIFGVAVDAIDMQSAVERLIALFESGGKGFVCAAGVHGVMEAQRHARLREVYAKAAMIVPDGMPLVWAGQAQGKSWMRRVTGPDLMLEVFARPEFAGVTHFLYGGEPGVAEELRLRLTQRFPWINILGTYTPPFRDLNGEEERQLISTIAALKPEMIWVGIGCPRQELFMARYLPLLDTRLMFGVGAAFDYHTGRIRDCSEWIKRAGLQWLHRLMQDPRRLWRRYLRNNPAFLWRMAWQFLAPCRSKETQTREGRHRQSSPAHGKPTSAQLPNVHTKASMPGETMNIHRIGPALLAAVLAVAAVAGQTQPQPRRIEIAASRFSFDPGEITLKKGEPVVLVLKSVDVAHGIRFRELHVDLNASAGATAEAAFTPEKTGDFIGHCSVFCGSGHGSMQLKLHVAE